MHRSTVSLSLRDHPRIPAHTRERVKAIARELGYRIDPLVSALMQIRRSPGLNREGSLAFVSHSATPQPGGIAWPDYFPGAVARAAESGLRVQRFAWDGSDPTARRLLQEFSTLGIKGVLIDSSAVAVRAQPAESDRFSWMAIGPLTSPAVHHVTEHYFAAVEDALQRCAAYGYERVGFVPAATAIAPWRTDRALGAYTIQQLRRPPGVALPICPGQPAAFPLFRDWFLAHAPTALLTDDPVRVRSWLAQLGRCVPADVGLVSVSLGPAAECDGYYFDAASIGALAVDALLDLMHRHETGVPAVAHEILLGAAWHEHGTLPLRAPAAVLTALPPS